MSAHALIAPLRRVRLFQSLSDAQLERVAREAERVVFRGGETICVEGQTADGAILIASDGAVMIGKEGDAGEPLEVFSLIGEMAMVVEHLYGATVVARQSVRAMRISRLAVHKLILADPSIAEALVEVVSGRLKAVTQHLRNVDEQVAASLDQLGGFGAAAALARNYPARVAASATMH